MKSSRSLDAELAQVFMAEYQDTRRVESAVRAVRLAIEARSKDDSGQQLSLTWQRGPEAQQIPPELAVSVLDCVAVVFSMRNGERVLACTRRDGANARAVAASILRDRGYSYPAIAAALGHRYHTRALDGVRAVEARPALQEAKAAAVAVLEGRAVDGSKEAA